MDDLSHVNEAAGQLGQPSRLVHEAEERWRQQREHERAEKALSAEIDQMRELIWSLVRTGVKQKYIAGQVGVSPSAVSQFLNGKYPGDLLALFDKLSRWRETLDQDRREPLPIPDQCVETPTGNRIEQTLAFAQAEPTIVVIYGNPGLGKTTSIARYQSEGRNVWVTTSSPASGGMQATIVQVAAAIGLRGLPLTPHQLSREIVAKLRGSQGLLVVDEAQHLSREAIDQLRSFHDSASIGLCLCGNMHVYARVYGRENSEYLAQFSSRVGNKLILREPAAGDVDAVLELWKIRGGAEAEFARQVASQPGALRSLYQCLRQATLAASATGRPIDVKLMREARASLGFGAEL